MINDKSYLKQVLMSKHTSLTKSIGSPSDVRTSRIKERETEMKEKNSDLPIEYASNRMNIKDLIDSNKNYNK